MDCHRARQGLQSSGTSAYRIEQRRLSGSTGTDTVAGARGLGHCIQDTENGLHSKDLSGLAFQVHILKQKLWFLD